MVKFLILVIFILLFIIFKQFRKDGTLHLEDNSVQLNIYLTKEELINRKHIVLEIS